MRLRLIIWRRGVGVRRVSLPTSRRKAAMLDVTPVQMEGVRRSSRKALPPDRLLYSVAETLKRIKTEKTLYRLKEDLSEDDSDVDSDMEYSDEEEEDSDEDETDVDSSHDKCDVARKTGRQRALSEYELKRLENIRQNRAFLASMNLLEATDELRQSTQPKPSQRGLTRSRAVVNKKYEPRRSLRLQLKEPQVKTLCSEPEE